METAPHGALDTPCCLCGGGKPTPSDVYGGWRADLGDQQEERGTGRMEHHRQGHCRLLRGSLIIALLWMDKDQDLDNRFTKAKDIIAILVGILGTIVGFYFGSNLNGPPLAGVTQPATLSSANATAASRLGSAATTGAASIGSPGVSPGAPQEVPPASNAPPGATGSGPATPEAAPATPR